MAKSTDSPKVALTKRLHREGRYDKYVEKRDALKIEGVSPLEAWKQALAYFPPLDGSPLEVPGLKPIDSGELDGSAIDPDEFTPLPPKPTAAPAADPEEEFYLDGAAGSDDEIGQTNSEGATVEVEEELPEVLEVKPDSELTAEEKAVSVEDPDTIDLTGLPRDKEKRKDLVLARLLKKVPARRTANPAVVADWIYNNYKNPYEDIHPKDIPSRGALHHLVLVNGSDKAYDTFIKETWVKTMPSKQDMADQGKSGDKHAKQHRMLDAFEEDYYARESEQEKAEAEQELE